MRVLFQWPPSELRITVSVSRSSPVIYATNACLEYHKALLYFIALTYATSNSRIVTWKVTIPYALKASVLRK
jgi:hypothetical protein